MIAIEYRNGASIETRKAGTEIFDYIERYYNHHRKHSALNYRTPAQFEAHINSAN